MHSCPSSICPSPSTGWSWDQREAPASAGVVSNLPGLASSPAVSEWRLADEGLVTEGERPARRPHPQPHRAPKSLPHPALAPRLRPRRSAMIGTGLRVAARLGHRGALPGARFLPPTSAFGSSTDSLVSAFPAQPEGQPFSWGGWDEGVPQSPLPRSWLGQVGSVLGSCLCKGKVLSRSQAVQTQHQDHRDHFLLA